MAWWRGYPALHNPGPSPDTLSLASLTKRGYRAHWTPLHCQLAFGRLGMLRCSEVGLGPGWASRCRLIGSLRRECRRRSNSNVFRRFAWSCWGGDWWEPSLHAAPELPLCQGERQSNLARPFRGGGRRQPCVGRSLAIFHGDSPPREYPGK